MKYGSLLHFALNTVKDAYLVVPMKKVFAPRLKTTKPRDI
jgi:hypothetical protein